MTGSTVDRHVDEYGVSHLYAEDLRDLAFAQGYVQARDRLFQMDVLRHVGRGDSASVLGPGQLASDVQVRRDLYDEEGLHRQYATAPADLRTAFEGFADGVNHAMAAMLREGEVPAKFAAVGHVPEAWEPVDSVAVAVYMVGYFGVFGGEELGNAVRLHRLRGTVGDEERAWAAYGDLNDPRVHGNHTASIPREHLTVDGGEDALAYGAVPDEQLELARAAAGATPWGVEAADAPELTGLREARGVTAGCGFGSNAVALAGEHTETGHPMLLGGPQMGYYRPPVVHEVGLHGAGFDTVGIGVVGTPGVVVGRRPEFAWSVTSGYDDMVDTVAVRLHPEDRHRYEWEGRYREMRTRRVTHRPSRVATLLGNGGMRGPVEQELAWVEADGHEMPVVAWNPDERVAWAQRTTTREDELEGVWAMTRVARAESSTEALAAVESLPFSFNYLIADDEDIHYGHAGRVPERAGDYDPRLPLPAGDELWSGTVHTLADRGMSVRNPDRGWVVQWNNAPVGGWRAGDPEGTWDEVHRVDALADLVAERVDEGPLAFEDVADLVWASGRHDPVARHTAPAMVAAGEGTEDRTVRTMAAHLREWADAGYPWSTSRGRHHPGLRIWEVVREELGTRALVEHLGELAPDPQWEPPRSVTPGEDGSVHAGDHGSTDRGDGLLARALEGHTAYDWLGEDPEATVRASMSRAAERLREEFGSDDPSDWRVRERTVKFDPMGALPELDVPIVHRGTFNHVVAPGEDRAASVLPPSNRGHLGLAPLPGVVRGEAPAKLRDQLDNYTGFTYKPMPVGRQQVEERAVEHTHVRPRSAPGPFPRLRALIGR